MRVITDPFTAASATVRIEFDGFDGFMFATRPNQMWPLSELRHGGGQMSLTVAVNGETVIDSDADLPDGIPNNGESDLIVRVDVAKDGTTKFDKVRPGSGMQKPSRAGYCPGLP